MEKNRYSNLNGFFDGEERIASSFEFNDEDFSDKNRMSDPIFKSIGYPSKIFYPNIQKYIKSYTKEGGVVLDSCAGSGSTGIAALFEGRKVVLIDDSPLATNMEYNLLNFVDIEKLEKEYKKLIKELTDLINGIYETNYSTGEKGYADVIIASNVYTCPSCSNEIVLYRNDTGKRSEYKCPHCGKIINIANTEIKKLQIDKRRPVEVTINGGRKKETRSITSEDIVLWNEVLDRYETQYGNLWAPTEQIVYNRAYPRIGGWPGFAIDASVSDLFPKNNLLALKILNNYIETKIEDKDIAAFMKFIFLETLFRTSSRLFTGSGIKNVYHIPPMGKEQNVLTVFKRKYKTIVEAKKILQKRLTKEQSENDVRIVKCDAKQIPLPNNSIDYAFIDPPYGGMVPYAELNLFYSAWLNEKEDLENEIMIPMDYEKKEGYVELWGTYMEKAFGEVFRVLKNGAYFTVAFHSTYSNIWNELKDIMQHRLGFEFINIVENERGTTFHTNHINDTNPVSAFITYRKPEDGMSHPTEVHKTSVFEVFNLEFLGEGKTFRAIQSQIIKVVNENNIAKVPEDREILTWLDTVATKEGTKYIRK